VADWTTISSLATAGGTLILAMATFASVRSANRAARVAEELLLTGLRPLLLAARFGDPPEKVTWQDEHLTKAAGGRGVIEEEHGVIYMAIALRNAGAGLAVLHAWNVRVGGLEDLRQDPVQAEDFRRLSRDLYIAPNDNGFWQGAIRDEDDPDRAVMEDIVAKPRRFSIDVLYGDQEGGQRTVTRFTYNPIGDGYMCSATRHWRLDRNDPR